MRLRSLCRVGNVPLEVAPSLVVELDLPTVRAWRADWAPETDEDCALQQREAGGKLEFAGILRKTTVASGRLQRGLMRADATLFVGERQVKVWLPRPKSLRVIWIQALSVGDTPSSSKVVVVQDDDDDDEFDEEEDDARGACDADVEAARARFRSEERSLPEGWAQLRDAVTGNDFYVDLETNRSTWVRPRRSTLNGAATEEAARKAGERLAVAWLLQRAVAAEVEAFLGKELIEAPILRSLVDEAKRCPLFEHDAAWPGVVDDAVATFPELLEKTAELRQYDNSYDDSSSSDASSCCQQRGAKFHVAQAVAQPLFFLGLASWRTLSASSDADLLEAKFATALRAMVDDLVLKKTSDLAFSLALTTAKKVDELPEKPRRVVEAALPLAALRLARAASRPRSESRRRLAAVLEATPTQTVVAAIRVGAFPTSPSVSRGLVDLFVKKQLANGFTETIAQKVVRASLGIDDKELKRLFQDVPPALREQIRGQPDSKALENLADDLEAKAGVRLDAPLKAAVERAANLEGYRRRAERVVAAYGEASYVDLVSNLYPALLEPVSRLLDDTKSSAADVLAAFVATVDRAVKAADVDKKTVRDLFSNDDRFSMVYADLRRLADKTLKWLHRAAATKDTHRRWAKAAEWFRKLLATFSLDLALPPSKDNHHIHADLATLLEKWQTKDQDLGALASLTDADLPALAALLPAFTDDLRRQWQIRRAEMALSSEQEGEGPTMTFSL